MASACQTRTSLLFPVAFFLLSLLALSPPVNGSTYLPDNSSCGSEAVIGTGRFADLSFGGECNGADSSDSSYWDSFGADTAVKYNSDVYPTTDTRRCKPPRLQGCCSDCTQATGVQGVFQVPLGGKCPLPGSNPQTGSSVYCPSGAGSINATSCCAFAVSHKSLFWQHFVPPG